MTIRLLMAVASALAFGAGCSVDEAGKGRPATIPAAASSTLHGRIAYSTPRGDIWVMNADGTGRSRITNRKRLRSRSLTRRTEDRLSHVTRTLRPGSAWDWPRGRLRRQRRDAAGAPDPTPHGRSLPCLVAEREEDRFQRATAGRQADRHHPCNEPRREWRERSRSLRRMRHLVTRQLENHVLLAPG